MMQQDFVLVINLFAHIIVLVIVYSFAKLALHIEYMLYFTYTLLISTKQ